MTPEKKGLCDYMVFKEPLKVKLADNSILLAYGKGSLRFTVYDCTEKVDVVLKDVLYVPKTQNKLLSLPSMAERGAEIQFKGQFCKVIIDDKSFAIAHKHGKLYKLNTEPVHTS